jgi:hypothetical protein
MEEEKELTMQNYFETNTAPLFAADFHYFRIPHAQWELMLTRLKQMGVSDVTVTLPWCFHEFQQGTIDLCGTTSARRDVAGLLSLCTLFNLHCILKPGPYSNGGILGEGIPAWLLRDADNLDDVLPAAVERWYKALSKTLTGQQWPDGPIVAIEIDGEPAGGQQPTLDKQLTEVEWRIWLRKRYDGIEALNAAYGTEHRTVNDVQFPQTWTNASTPLEKDAKTFLEEMRGDILTNYAGVLVDAGWQIPIYPSMLETLPDLPAIHTHSLTVSEPLPALGRGKKISSKRVILNLQHPIQVDPDPVEVGCGPVWAENAPVRADGTVRPKFWEMRHYLWKHTLPKTTVEDKELSLSFKDGLLVTCRGDVTLKIDTVAGPKSTVYRLKLNGRLVADDKLKVRRGKLSGPYLTEDDGEQTDLIFLLDDPFTPLSGFLLNYLSVLLMAQTKTLARCATLAERLGEILTPGQPEAEPAGPEHPTPTSYTLAEARRGLHEADAALRKAMTSINALSEGFSTILGQEHPEVIPQPAITPVAVSPAVFEGVAKDILVEVGVTCANIVPQLKSAATTLQKVIDASDSFTLEQYQQSYATAVTAAQTARESLLEVIAQLRLEIASGRLPLVVWRIHDQVQAIAENLRWGVLRE